MHSLFRTKALSGVLSLMIAALLFPVTLEAGSVWLVVGSPSPTPQSGRLFETTLKFSTWDAAMGAYSVTVLYDPSILKIIQVTTPGESEFYGNTFADEKSFASGMTEITAFQTDNLSDQNAPAAFATILWQALGTPGTVATIAVKPRTMIDSIWRPVEVNNSSVTFEIEALSPLIVGAPGALQDGEVNVPYTAPLNIGGGAPPYIISVVKGALPRGLSLNSEGIVTGTPTKRANKRFTLEVSDQVGSLVSKTFRIRILKAKTAAKALSIRTRSLKKAKVGKRYRTTLRAKGGKKPYDWSIVSGDLPKGLKFNRGKISGNPTVSGTFPLTFKVRDSLGTAAQKSFTFIVN